MIIQQPQSGLSFLFWSHYTTTLTLRFLTEEIIFSPWQHCFLFITKTRPAYSFLCYFFSLFLAVTSVTGWINKTTSLLIRVQPQEEQLFKTQPTPCPARGRQTRVLMDSTAHPGLRPRYEVVQPHLLMISFLVNPYY